VIVLFTSITLKQLKENRKIVLFSDSLKLDEHILWLFWVDCENQHDEIHKPAPISTKSQSSSKQSSWSNVL